MKRVGTKMTMVRGDTERFTVSRRNKETKVLLPFETGDTVYFTVKKISTDTTPQFQIVVSEFVDGKAPITILPEHTKEMAYRDYRYDIQVTKANGDVNTIVWADTFTIAEEITDE